MTPQTISVDEARNIIDKLSNKNFGFGSRVHFKNEPTYHWFFISTFPNEYGDMVVNLWRQDEGYRTYLANNDLTRLPNPVLIGDVLEKMRQIDCHDTYILRLWGECGKLTDSLNDILDSSEKEEHTEWINDEGDHEEWEIIKPNTPASNLFIFLNQLFN